MRKLWTFRIYWLTKKPSNCRWIFFEISKSFPKEEIYSLTDQIRRSSRSVCGQIAEAYRKRRYPNHYTSKLTDGDAENAETQVWINFAFACQYIHRDTYQLLLKNSHEVGRLIGTMIAHPEKFGVKSNHSP